MLILWGDFAVLKLLLAVEPLRKGLIQLSLKFTFTENGLGAHSPKFTFTIIDQRAFLLTDDEPILASKPVYNWEMSLFLGNVHLNFFQ